jgi:hypothetical protein
MKFYNKQGVEVSTEECIKFDEKYCRIGATVLSNGNWISTVFLHGIDHRFSYGDGANLKPILFETMVFNSQSDLKEIDCQRYSTELEAIEGHRIMITKYEPHFEFAQGHNNQCCEFIDIIQHWPVFFNRVFICKNNPDLIISTSWNESPQDNYQFNVHIKTYENTAANSNKIFQKKAQQAIYKYVTRKMELMGGLKKGNFNIILSECKPKPPRIIKVPND